MHRLAEPCYPFDFSVGLSRMPMLNLNAARALVCLRYGIGDVVMELPVLRALRRAIPRARITALGAFPATQLLDGTGIVDETVDLRAWGLTHRWDEGCRESRRPFREWVREQRFDHVLDTHHAPPAVLLAIRALGIETLESSEEAEARALESGESGTAAVSWGARRGWGLDVETSPLPCIIPRREHIEEAERFLADQGLESATPFAVSPVASLELKRWPVRKLAIVVDRLTSESARPVLLFRGPQRSTGRELLRLVRCPEQVRIVGPLHLMVIAALLARCRALLTNDTGLMHIAAAVGLPTLGIFGPTRPSIYRPPGLHVLTAEPAGVACPHWETASLHPPACFVERRCLVGWRGCIQATTVDRVQAGLSELLEIGTRVRPTELWLDRARASAAQTRSAAAPPLNVRPVGSRS